MSKRDEFVAEMKRLEEAINKTNSPYLKKDYEKALIEMRKELVEYDNYMNQSKKLIKK